MFQNSPTLGSRISPVPSPPNPGSPSGQSGGSGDIPPSSLDQRLQRLQLQLSTAQLATTSNSALQHGAAVAAAAAYSSLISHSNAHQRSSPPPNFVLQNLHSIREDSGDSGEIVSMDALAAGDDGAQPGSGRGPQESDEKKSAKKFAKNPQISITDTHGHVVPVTSSQDSDDMVAEEVSSAAATTTTGSLPGPPAEPTSPLKSSEFGWQPPFGLQSMFSQYAGLTLASIPAADPHSVLGNVSQVHDTSSPVFGVFSSGELESTGGRDASQCRVMAAAQAPFARCSTEAAASIFSYPAGLIHDAEADARTSMLVASAGKLEQAMALCSGYNGMAQDSAASSEALLTKRTVAELLHTIKYVLDKHRPHIIYHHSGDNLFLLEGANVQMEMEICHGDSQRGLKFRKIAGDNLHFDKLRKELVASMDL